MRHNIFKSIFTLILTLVAFPMMGQDFMTVHFKNGTSRTFHFSNIEAISTSRIDADGILHSDYQYQHITTLNNEFVYDLAIIDSVSFTKYNEESARENFTSAMNVALTNLADCESISDVENKLDIIRNADGVEKVWTDGDFLRIKPRSSKPFTIDFGNYGLSNENESRSLSRLYESIKMAERPDIERPNGEKLKMVIANEMNNDMRDSWQNNISNYLTPLEDKLDDAGISVKYVPMPDLEFFRSEMYDYDVVLLCTHGGYYSLSDEHILLSSPILGEVLVTEDNENGIDESVFQEEYDKIFTDDRYKDAIDDMELYVHKEKRTINGVARDHWIGYPIIHESFIENRATKSFTHPKATLFMASCQTLKGNNNYTDNINDNLARIFFDKRGLNTYLGYTESTYFCQRTGPLFFESYFNNTSAWKAYDDLEEKPVSDKGWDHVVSGTSKDEDVIEYNNNGTIKREYTAHLKILSKDKKDEDLLHFFLSTPNTIDTDEKDALDSYNKEKAVYISATIMALDPHNVVKGFNYGTDKYNLTQDKKADIAMKTIEVGKGNYLIQAKLSDLNPGNTYYYCAYTYDGQNYNYGDTCSFTLYHNLQVPAQRLELEEGEKVSFTIAAGSGEYSAESDRDYVATASIYGNEVRIEAFNEGDAIITITDTKTDQKADVIIKVYKKAVPEITLSTQEVYLEVGETQQIEITSGSGSYSVWVYAPEVANVNINGSIITIKGLSAGKTIAKAIDDITGKEKSFGIEVKESSTVTDDEELLLSKQVNGIDYRIYKKIIDPSDYHINPDGWKCYRSELILETTSNGNKKTTVLDNYIYLDDSRGHHGGQTPCMLLDFSENQMIIFINSKDGGKNYTMEGYAYVSPINNYNFSKETVFTAANWGWFPFFSLSGSTVQLNYFSYAGYYAMMAERNGSGSWSNQRVGSIRPEAFEEMSNANGPVTVVENSEFPIPDDGSPAEAIDLGLPSGTLWASYNIGAKKPEDFGGFYAWGETFEKTDYSQTDYTKYGKYTASDGLTELEPEDDVATVLWGTPWHIPTKTQIYELINNCTWTWTTINGINGFRVMGSNGNSIFLPAAGTKADGSHNVANSRLTYWSNSVNLSNKNQAGMMWSWETPPAEYDTVVRWFGYSVRAVKDAEEVDERMEDIIPGDIRKEIEDYIPIYDGINPPNIEGTYYINPDILIASSLSYDKIGKQYDYEYDKFSNQDMIKNTINMVRVQGNVSEWAKGDGAFISGSGNNFTIYFDLEGQNSGISFKEAYVISGTKTANGIKNIVFGFILKEKSYDPDSKVVPVGTYRFFKDEDGMSESVAWPYGNQYGARKRMVEGRILPSAHDAK